MTATEAYNTIQSKEDYTILFNSRDGVPFYESARRTSMIFYKRIKEIKNPHESDEAKALKDMLIKMAKDRGIPQTNKRPR